MIPFHASGRQQAAFDILNGFLVYSYQASTRTRFNGHVANSHATFQGQCANGRATKLNGVASTAGCSNFANDGQHNVFSGDTLGHRAFDLDEHVLGFFGQQSLRGHDVLNFTGTNAVCECAKCTVCGSV